MPLTGSVSQFSHSVMSDTVNPWPTACQASLSITNSQTLLKLISIESVMPTNHLILCHSLLLPSSIFPSIRVFSNESVLLIRWPKCWSFSFSIGPSNEYSARFPLGWTGWISLQSKGLSRVFSNTTVQKHHFLSAQLSLKSNSHIHWRRKWQPIPVFLPRESCGRGAWWAAIYGVMQSQT